MEEEEFVPLSRTRTRRAPGAKEGARGTAWRRRPNHLLLRQRPVEESRGRQASVAIFQECAHFRGGGGLSRCQSPTFRLP